MDRARRVGLTALILVALSAPAGGPGATPASAAPVGWPVSSLVVSEVQTGGSSASDEFIEVANQGALSVDLTGLELVYATASGSTVTRKVAWDTTTILSPGRRLLVANSAGVHVAIADAVYSGGFAATGGAIALRLIGGAVVDSVGWGDATSGFVEGAVAPAPPAGSSLERRPGGIAGNGADTNDNAADWFVQGLPSPQGLGAPPVPSATPTPVATPTPAGSPTPGATPSPTPDPTPSPVPSPVATPTPTPTATPTPTPMATPAPTPTPTPTATPTPTPSPDPTPIPIATARALADGTTVTLEGVLTTALGAVESGRGGFVQDSTGGIAIYLDAVVSGSWPAGTSVTLTGTLSSRFAQRTLRLAETAINGVGATGLPMAVPITIAEANEAYEGARVSVTGTIAGAPDALADGLGITLDDGTGSIRAVIGIDAQAGLTLASGMIATVSGPLGQRDSSGTGGSGYRVHATSGGELALSEPMPSPTPTPSPSPTPTATPTPTPIGTPEATPTASATQPVIAVRGLAVGAVVTIEGVVTAEAGRLGTPALIAVADASAGIAVRLPNGTAFARGTRLRITGTLAAPYGQLEIKAAASGLEPLGTADPPTPMPAGPGPLDESSEGSLVSGTGTIATKPKRSAGGDLTIVLERPGAASLKVIADASSQVVAGAFSVGATYRLTGVVGQRASRKGALDGYRVCLRDPADVVVMAGSAAGTEGTLLQSGSSGTGPADASSTPIARVIGRIKESVTIAGVVTAPPQLLDATRRRIVVQDQSGAIEVLLPSGTEAPTVGTRVRVTGEVGVAYGAPRVRANELSVLTGGRPLSPKAIRKAPGHALEWQLVSFTGRVDNVRKLGERWRAEMLVGGARVVVVGQPGSGIEVASVVEGRMARVTGIVRRPFPTATDQRYAVLPRSRADLDILGAAPASASGGAAANGQRQGPPGDIAGRGGSLAPDGTVDADLVDLETLTGRAVRVGGLVVDLRPDGLLLDDGTTTGLVVLRGEALALLPLLEPDDAINAIGHVERLPDGLAVVVDEASGIIQAGDPVAPDAGFASSDARIGADQAAPIALRPAVPTSRAGLLDAAQGLGAGLVGLGTLLLLSCASLAITLARRARTRRRLEATVAARVAALGEPSGSRSGPRSAERAGGAFR